MEGKGENDNFLSVNFQSKNSKTKLIYQTNFAVWNEADKVGWFETENWCGGEENKKGAMWNERKNYKNQ